jgi:hypothetical protein
MNVEITEHARIQMIERGAVDGEVKTAIEQGQPEPARLGRTMYRKNFPFNSNWRGRDYRTKQVAPVVAVEGDKLLVVTVYVFYF